MKMEKNTQPMDENEKIKIKEARYLIIIPLVITVICLWFDILTNFVAGEYKKEIITTTVVAMLDTAVESNNVVVEILTETNWVDNLASILRCGIGYLFPSLLSIVVAMIWQQINLKDNSYNLNKKKTAKTIFATVLYSVAFISCLISYNAITATIFCVVSFIYIIWFYNNGLDNRIKIKKDMSEDDFYAQYVAENEK